MPSQHGREIGLSDAQIAAIAEAVCARLTEPPFLDRIADAVAAAAGRRSSEGAEAGRARSQAAAVGPVPVGPYEVSPDFADVSWDGDAPPPAMWINASAPSASSAAPERPRPTGPLISRTHPDGRTEAE